MAVAGKQGACVQLSSTIVSVWSIDYTHCQTASAALVTPLIYVLSVVSGI